MNQTKDSAATITFGHVVPLEAKELPEDGTFEGYLAIYGNVDQGGDIVQAGAFDASLRERPAPRVKMLLHHDPKRPVGVWDSMRSDSKGLFARGRLLLDTQDGRESYALMKAGALDGLSIGYKSINPQIDRASGIRTIGEAALWEGSLVTFPMNPQSVITGVKSADAIDTIETLSDAERVLREAGHFSRKEALDFVSRVKRIAQREAGDDQGAANALKRLTELFRS